MTNPVLRLLAPLALLAAPAAAQTSILPYLPKETIVAVSAPDLTSSVARFQKMPLARMWAEDEVQKFLADVKKMVGQKLDEALQQGKEMHAQGQLPMDPSKLLELRLHSAALAVTRLELHMGDMGPMPKIGVLVHLDFGDTSQAWKDLIQMGLGLLEQQAGDELRKTEAKVGDTTVMTLGPKADEGMEMALNVAMLPSGILLGTLADDVKGVLDCMQKKTPALGATAAYQSVSKRLQAAGAEVESFSRMDPIVDFALAGLEVASQMSPELAMVDMDGVKRALDAMGWRNLGLSGSSIAYVDGKSVERSFQSGQAAGKQLDMSFLKWVPKDAAALSAGTMDVPALYDTLRKGLEAYDPELAKQLLGQLEQIEAQIGFKLRDDLFGSFGDQYVTWSMAVASMQAAPEMAYLLKVEKPDNLVKVIKAMTQMSEGHVELEESEKRGLKAYTLKINLDAIQGLPFNPFDFLQPTFAFKNGYMVVALSAPDVRRAAQRMDREDDPKGDIRSNKEFASVAAQLPANLRSMSFSDWKVQFESFYQLGTGLLTMVPMGDDVPIDPALLPDAATLTKHLFPTFSYSVAHEDGVESVSVSPFGPETMLMLGALFGAGATVFGAMRGGF
ncbi:MAG: hypothetical protein JNK49_11990 [Planctomycetes bacterium]|nr:hypothetical protein [Planctomycetota bacterium]